MAKNRLLVYKPYTSEKLRNDISQETGRIAQECLASVMDHALRKAKFCEEDNGEIYGLYFSPLI